MRSSSNERCTISIYPRLHVTLIGMNDEGYRRNGGVGFSMAEPSAKITVTSASSFRLDDMRKHPLQPREQSRLVDVASKFAARAVRVEISGEMPSHFGFGSATGIRLATLEAISVVTGKFSKRDDLVLTSGRGGTSGIGVTTYFEGGLVVDLGVKQAETEILPSSALECVRPAPLVLSRVALPQWEVGVCTPSNIQPLTEDQEIEFFRRACPVPSPAVNETLYHVIYGLLASALEKDLKIFCDAVKLIQGCTWKRLERELHGDRLLTLEAAIYEAGAAAVGLSSIGPCLFFLGDNLGTVAAKLREQRPEHVWQVSSVFNSGRTLETS